MKVNCEIVEDLLPLYADEVCTESSKQAVIEHLQKCEKCRRMVEMTQAISVPKLELDKPKADKAVKKGFKKIRVRWWISIAAVLLLSTITFSIWYYHHIPEVPPVVVQREKQLASEFMDLLCQGNYEKAYEYMDIEDMKQDWLEDWFEEEELVDIEEKGLAKFCEFGQKLEDAGGIEKYVYMDMSISSQKKDGTQIYRIEYRVRYMNNRWTDFTLTVSKDGIDFFTNDESFLVDPLAALGSWGEYLWQDYSGCYYDTELKQYVYYNNIQ